MESTGKILVAGASGALGLEIVKLLKAHQRPLRVLTRSSKGVSRLSEFTEDIWKADAAKNPSAIEGITRGIHTVISALGKSVSLFTPSEESFFESDFLANKNLLDQALRHQVRRFIYISIKGADSKQDFSIARAHDLVEKSLRASTIPNTIIRPVGFYSGLNDLATLAKRKIIPLIGKGTARTNSIHHRDLAKVVVSFLKEGPELIEVGGPEILSRREMAEMVRNYIGGEIIHIPLPMARLGASFSTFFSPQTQHKLEYFTYVTTNDMMGEINGNIRFRDYLRELDLKQLR